MLSGNKYWFWLFVLMVLFQVVIYRASLIPCGDVVCLNVPIFSLIVSPIIGMFLGLASETLSAKRIILSLVFVAVFLFIPMSVIFGHETALLDGGLYGMILVVSLLVGVGILLGKGIRWGIIALKRIYG